MKLNRRFNAWAIFDKDGRLSPETIRQTRAKCIEDFVGILSWEQWEAYGHECLKVSIYGPTERQRKK